MIVQQVLPLVIASMLFNMLIKYQFALIIYHQILITTKTPTTKLKLPIMVEVQQFVIET